jgi:HTH-type transcriptional regulator/antitoxin HigA
MNASIRSTFSITPSRILGTQAGLADLLGSRSRASEVLSRRRALTVDMIHKISEAWKLPAELLVRPYTVEKAA